jgi:hypothetical protein
MRPPFRNRLLGKFNGWIAGADIVLWATKIKREAAECRF